MVLLHEFVKKTQATPAKELKLADRRMKEHSRNEQQMRTRRVNA